MAGPATQSQVRSPSSQGPSRPSAPWITLGKSPGASRKPLGRDRHEEHRRALIERGEIDEAFSIAEGIPAGEDKNDALKSVVDSLVRSNDLARASSGR